jgi:hypothetical protein
MKVIIAGGRNITFPSEILRAVKDSGFEITEVVCGGARGADELGKLWASAHDIPVKFFLAAWDLYGKSAGYKRNVEMGNYADAAIVVWDGKSKGSGHMVNIMAKLKKPCFQRIVVDKVEGHLDPKCDLAKIF